MSLSPRLTISLGVCVALLSSAFGQITTSPSAGGNALTTNPLSQFASTTSAQLRGVLSDENGTGVALFSGASNPNFDGIMLTVNGDNNTPGSGKKKLYFDGDSKLICLNSSGQSYTLDDTALTASREFTLPDRTGPLATSTANPLLGIRDTSAAFDVTLAATSSAVLTAGRTLTINMGNAAHTLAFGTTANTITFPSVTSDTVAMLAASQAFTNKDLSGAGNSFPTLNQDTTGSAAKVVGTATNDNATAGNVGQEIESLKDNAHTVSLSNGTAADVTSISLTAGDWDVEGNVNFTETTSTVTARTAGINTTSATLPTDGSEAYCGVQSTVTSETNSIALPRKRISIASTTTVYLVSKASFSAGTCASFGAITARRVR